MLEMASIEDIPNIEIDVQNDENMSEIEEGELESDEDITHKKKDKAKQNGARILSSPVAYDDDESFANGVNDLETFGVSKELTKSTHPVDTTTSRDEFVVGFDPTSVEHQERRGQRARRFGLPEEEVIEEDQLNQLFTSLGQDRTSPDLCPERIHVHGIEHLSVEDIMKYFSKHKPLRVERINSKSCNVVWMDRLSGCRAMLDLTYDLQSLLNPPAPSSPEHMQVDDDELNLLSSDEEEDLTVGKKNENHEVKTFPDWMNGRSLPLIKKFMPRHGQWRLGKSWHNAKYLFMKFATRDDKPTLRRVGNQIYTNRFKRGQHQRKTRGREEPVFIAIECDFDKELRSATEKLQRTLRTQKLQQQNQISSSGSESSGLSSDDSGDELAEEEMDMERELHHLLQTIPEQRFMRMHADDEEQTLVARRQAQAARAVDRQRISQEVVSKKHLVSDLRSRIPRNDASIHSGKRKYNYYRQNNQSTSSGSDSDEPNVKYEKLTIQVNPSDI